MGSSDDQSISVLLVDDDPEEHLLVRKYLRNARTGSYDLMAVTAFSDALDALRDHAFEVVLVDYYLGNRLGTELLEEMRQRVIDVPAILLTGRGSLQTDLQAMELGAADYLEKGALTPELLERSIRYAVGNHRAQAQLRRANEDLEVRVRERTQELDRSNQALERFAQVVAQDLQEPLRALTRQIQDIKAQSRRKECASVLADLDRVALSARNMELLIRSVLEYSGVARDTQAPKAVDLQKTVANICAEVQTMLRDAGATVNAQGLPTVKGHPELLAGLLENLIDNAVTFRADRPLAIDISAERKGDDWLCVVRDNGIGIRNEDLDDIFLMFHRGGRGEERAGIGMGLALCRKIVEYHGGKIWADSQLGEWSAFYFSLPAEE